MKKNSESPRLVFDRIWVLPHSLFRLDKGYVLRGQGTAKTAAKGEKKMRIVSDQLIAGYPALEVRDFVRRNRLTGFFVETAEAELALSPRSAATFLRRLINLEFVKESGNSNGQKVFQLTSGGQALANASAASLLSGPHTRLANWSSPTSATSAGCGTSVICPGLLYFAAAEYRCRCARNSGVRSQALHRRRICTV